MVTFTLKAPKLFQRCTETLSHYLQNIIDWSGCSGSSRVAKEYTSNLSDQVEVSIVA